MQKINENATSVMLDRNGQVIDVENLITNAKERAGEYPRKPEWPVEVENDRA